MKNFLIPIAAFALLGCEGGAADPDNNGDDNQSVKKINSCQCRQIDLGHVRFASNQTWTIGNQIWSAAVQTDFSDKETYSGPEWIKEDSGGYYTYC